MKKRLAIVAFALLVPVFFWGILALPALLRREHFYHGRPTSHWSKEIRKWLDNPVAWSPSWPDDWFGKSPQPAILGHDPSATPVLIDLLQDKDPVVREMAIKFLPFLLHSRPERKRLVSTLIEAAKQEDALFAQEARRALVCDLEPLPAEAVPVLVEALKDDSMSIGARFALERIGAEAVPDLTQALENPDPRVRRGAAVVLGSLGPAAWQAMPTLRKALNDSDSNVRLEVEKSLKLVVAR